MGEWYRVLRSSAVTLSKTFVQDEVATPAGGAVTVAVRRLADGVAITGSPFTASEAGPPGAYSFALPAQANLDLLTADWTGSYGGVNVTVRDIVEIVGGFIFPIPTARAAHLGLKKPPTRFTTADLAWWRTVVEVEAERIIGHAQVPRFDYTTVDGSGTDTLLLPRLFLRTVRACKISGTAMAAGELAALISTDAGVLYRPNGVAWPVGRRNIALEVEHGPEVPSPGVVHAATDRMRSIMEGRTSQIPDRAVSYSIGPDGVYRLALPTAKTTGIPNIDAAYQGAAIEAGGFA